MGMSDCPKCWDTLCSCGWEYRALDLDSRLQIAAAALGVTKELLKDSLDVPKEHPLFCDSKWRP